MNCFDVTFEILVDFTYWLRFPGNKQINKTLNYHEPHCCEKTVNLTMSAVYNFYDYLYRNGNLDSNINDRLMKTVLFAGPKKYKDFLFHINKDKPSVQRYLKQKEPVKIQRILSSEQIELIYHTVINIRDRFLIRLLFETGMRIGEALSLHIEDFEYNTVAGHRIRLVNRGELPNGARLKSGERVIHISQQLVDLFDDYMYEVLDELEFDSDFVFVKLSGKEKGHPMTYTNVAALFRELRRKTNINVSAHLLRHTNATLLYGETKDMKLVQERLGHAQIQTTMKMYVHPSENEIRKSWESAQILFEIRRRG
jgi:integrase